MKTPRRKVRNGWENTNHFGGLKQHYWKARFDEQEKHSHLQPSVVFADSGDSYHRSAQWLGKHQPLWRLADPGENY